MSEDIGYTSDWSCGESSSIIGENSSRRAGWMGVASLVVGLLALGTALYAAFAPRQVLERGRQRISGALSQGEQRARELAESARESVETAKSKLGSAHGATAQMSTAPGL